MDFSNVYIHALITFTSAGLGQQSLVEFAVSLIKLALTRQIRVSSVERFSNIFPRFVVSSEIFLDLSSALLYFSSGYRQLADAKYTIVRSI